jgi:xanthine dehydrogenase accessory factor
MAPWLNALTELARDGEPAVLVTIVVARGSTPRETGCKMVVTGTAQYDTIGGGNLEFTCVAVARNLLAGADGPVLREFPLGPRLGQCCGGHVTVLFEPFNPAILHVAVFGAGHVGRALVALLSGLPMSLTLLDTRPDALANAPPGVRVRLTADPAREVASLPNGTFVLVMTHDHQMDFEIVAEALARTEFTGVGLIGSATKRARFVHRLLRLGLDAEAIARLICPIGIPGIDGKRPAEIAVSVAAQLLQVRPQLGATMPKSAETPVRLMHPAPACGECGPACARSHAADVLA